MALGTTTGAFDFVKDALDGYTFIGPTEQFRGGADIARLSLGQSTRNYHTYASKWVVNEITAEFSISARRRSNAEVSEAVISEIDRLIAEMDAAQNDTYTISGVNFDTYVEDGKVIGRISSTIEHEELGK